MQKMCGCSILAAVYSIMYNFREGCRESDMTETVTLILEIIGTIAFAVSGALVGIEKRMDILGVAILGATTAVGGGIIRDLLLGSTPPQALQHPLYLIIAVCSAVVMFFTRIRSALRRNRALFDTVLLVMDSLGLGVFTAVGIGVAKGLSCGMFVSAFVGVMTGVGGGIMRDMMSGDIPFVFRKYFYCSASIIGAVITAGLWERIGSVPAMLTGAALIVLLRFLAAHFRWRLPRAVSDSDTDAADNAGQSGDDGR